MSLSSSKLDHTIYLDIVFVLEAQRYEKNSFSFTCSAAKNFVREGQSVTSSVTDVVLSPTVPSFYFIIVENGYKAPIKFLAGLFRRRHVANRAVEPEVLLKLKWSRSCFH